MKKEVVAIILFILVIGLIYTKPWEKAGVSAEDAANYVKEDMRTKFPSAELIEVLATKEEFGSYKIQGRVSFDMGSPCPQRLHLYYDYPSSNFVTWTENITRNCKVCEGLPQCVIAFEEEAVAASHTYTGGEKAQKYINDYSDALAVNELLGEFEWSKDVWLVTWDAPSASMKVLVYLSKPENRILKVVEQAK